MNTSNSVQKNMGNYHQYVNTNSTNTARKKEAVAPTIAIPELNKPDKVTLHLKREKLERDEISFDNKKRFEKMEREQERVAAHLKKGHEKLTENADISSSKATQPIPSNRFHVVA